MSQIDGFELVDLIKATVEELMKLTQDSSFQQMSSITELEQRLDQVKSPKSYTDENSTQYEQMLRYLENECR